MASHPKDQYEANRAIYFAPGVIRHYLSDELSPQEWACVRLCHAHIAGCAVLDIGVGAGRTTHHLQPLAERYEAIDYSPVMVDHVRRAMPHVKVRQADWRDLSVFDDASFDFIFATNNVLDSLVPQGRLEALGETRRLLRPQGVFAFSSHNLNYQYARNQPRLRWGANPLRWPASLVRYVRSARNFRRISPLRVETSEYALLNDEGHDYACVHYYATRQTVTRQLGDHGLRVVNVIDSRGQLMNESGDESESPNFMYVVEPVK